MELDFYIFQQINGLAGKYFWLDQAGIFFAKYLGYILVGTLIFLLTKGIYRYLPMVFWGLVSAAVARLGVVELIRFIFPRTRPFIENNVNLLVDKISQPAFPSGHAAFFFALSTVVYFYNKKAGILFLIASAFISISRVFVGVHWPSDILAGALAGIATSFLLGPVLQLVKNKFL